MGSLVGGLLGGGEGGGGGGGSSSSVQTVQVPDWLDSRNKTLVDRAETLSNQSFTPYDQQRIAGFNGDSQNAFQMGRDNIGQYNNLLSSASSGVYDLMNRAQGPTSAQIDQYMNPYLDNVLGINKRNTIEDYNTQQGLRDQEAGMINAFGGSRVAIRQSEADKQLAEQLQDMDYQGRFDAFNNAQDQFNVGTNVLNQGVNQALSTTAQGQAYNMADINQLLKQGELQRLQEQDQLDFNYQEFDREQAYPYENLSFLANIVNPLTGAYAGGTSTGTQGSASGGGGGGGSDMLGTVASLAPIALSLFSDERVKENIQEVGKLDNGMNVYSYNYKGDATPQIGLIAQEVEKQKPEAVGEVDGIKTVNYGEAVKLRDGGPVSSNMASRARLTPVSSAGRGSFPSIPAMPPISENPEIDGDGLEALLEGFGLGADDADGNMLSRLFKGGFDGVDSGNYSDVIGPTMSAGADGFFGLSGGGGSSFLSGLSFFAEGGAVEKEKPFFSVGPTTFTDERREAYERGELAPWLTWSPSSFGDRAEQYGEWIPDSPKDTRKERMLKDTLQYIDTSGQNITGAIKGVGSSISDLMAQQNMTMEEIEVEKMKNRHQKENEQLEKLRLRELIANKVGGEAQEGQEDPMVAANREAAEAQRGRVAEVNAQPMQGRTLTAGDLNPSSGVSSLNDFMRMRGQKGMSMQQPMDRKMPSNEKKGVNIPLLLAGITMLSTEGDLGDKALSGLSAATKYAGNEKRTELERAKLAQEKERQQFLDYIDYMKAQAYIDSVRLNAEKGSSLTPYQAGRLSNQERKLDLDEKRINAKLAEDSATIDGLDPFADLDISAIEELLASK